MPPSISTWTSAGLPAFAHTSSLHLLTTKAVPALPRNVATRLPHSAYGVLVRLSFDLSTYKIYGSYTKSTKFTPCARRAGRPRIAPPA